MYSTIWYKGPRLKGWQIIMTRTFLILVTFVPIAAMMIMAIIFSPIHCDSAYYLSISNLVSKGWHLYSEIDSGYTPLFIWFLAGINKVFALGTHYSLWVSMQVAMSIGLSFLVYKAAGILTDNKGIRLFAMWMTLVALLRSEGYQVLLELPSVTFGLILIVAFLKTKFKSKWEIIIAGIISTIPFWCKQYGAGFIFLFPIIFFRSEDNSNKGAKLLFYLFGVSIPFIACYLLYHDCWVAIYQGYGLDNNAKEVFGGQVLKSIPWAIKYFICRYCPILPLGLIPLFIGKKTALSYQKKTLLIVCTLGVLGFSLQFFFAKSSHYFIYMIPFAAIMCSYILDYFWNEKRRSIQVLGMIVVIFNICTLCNSAFKNVLYKDFCREFIPQKVREKQVAESFYLSSILDENDCKYCFCKDHSLMYLNYYSELIAPSADKKANFSFGPLAYDEEKYSKSIDICDAVIISPHAEQRLQNLIDKNCNHWEKIEFTTYNGPISLFLK